MKGTKKKPKTNRRWTQIYADETELLRSPQENLVNVRRWAARSSYNLQQNKSRYPEAYRGGAGMNRNQSRYYLRKSASIRGSSSCFSLCSRPFVACRAVALAEADPFAVSLLCPYLR
jgi:hypothetical protein